jgi:hypothetical protein
MNVSDILRADRYDLAQNVVFERVVGGEDGNGISMVDLDLEKIKHSDKENFGYVTALLVQKTLDIFQTHSLRWNMLPGMNIRIFRNLHYGGWMDVALEVKDKGKIWALIQNFTHKAIRRLLLNSLKT